MYGKFKRKGGANFNTAMSRFNTFYQPVNPHGYELSVTLKTRFWGGGGNGFILPAILKTQTAWIGALAPERSVYLNDENTMPRPVDGETPTITTKIGTTTFDIYVRFSETSKETFTDKVLRLIKNDTCADPQ